MKGSRPLTVLGVKKSGCTREKAHVAHASRKGESPQVAGSSRIWSQFSPVHVVASESDLGQGSSHLKSTSTNHAGNVVFERSVKSGRVFFFQFLIKFSF